MGSAVSDKIPKISFLSDFKMFAMLAVVEKRVLRKKLWDSDAEAASDDNGYESDSELTIPRYANREPSESIMKVVESDSRADDSDTGVHPKV